jgi:hypothetical protein
MGSSVVVTPAATYVLQTSGSSGAIATIPLAAHNCAFYLDPTDRTAGTRSTKYRVRAQILTNAVAPTSNWIVGLYQIATWGGPSSSSATIGSLGTMIAGSGIAFNGPIASAQLQNVSSDFNAPSAGFYVLGAMNSATSPAGAMVAIHATLQFRQV